MKKYSWVLALLLALTMAFVFIGCGGGDSDDSGDTGDTGGSGGTGDGGDAGGAGGGGDGGEQGTVTDFIKGLNGFESIVKELKEFDDGGPLKEPVGNYAQWKFAYDDIKAADYFLFTTDGSIEGANPNGFGGTQIGLQNISGAWGMSDKKITTPGWTDFKDHKDICLYAIKIIALPALEEKSGNYIGVNTGDDLRIYIGYWPNIAGLAPDGYVILVKGTLAKPDGAIDVKDSNDSDKVVGFCVKVE
jgi:hypothetical protein